MAQAPSNALVRVASAVAALAVVLPVLIWGGRNGALLLAGVVLVWGQHEYAGLALPAHRLRSTVALVALGGALVAALQTQQLLWVVGALFLGLMSTAWLVLFSPRDSVTGMHSEWGRLLLGLLYVPLPLGFFPLLLELPGGHGFGWLLLAFAGTWGGDTGGYFVGRAFGRHKLFPLVSPKKTWEGLAGGLFGAVLLCLALKFLFFPWASVLDCVLLGVAADLVGVTGDLVESMMKRDADVKDSGFFLPGHGGMLDRIDSLLFTLPLVYLYATVMGG